MNWREEQHVRATVSWKYSSPFPPPTVLIQFLCTFLPHKSLSFPSFCHHPIPLSTLQVFFLKKTWSPESLLSSSHPQHPAASPDLAHCGAQKRRRFLSLESLLTHSVHRKCSCPQYVAKEWKVELREKELLNLLYSSQGKKKRWNGRGSETLELLFKRTAEGAIDSKSRNQGKRTAHLFLLASNGESFKILAAGSRNQK